MIENSEFRVFTDPLEAELISRPNRFVMMVKTSDGSVHKAHCPNPGRLTEFLIPGQPLLVEFVSGEKTKKVGFFSETNSKPKTNSKSTPSRKRKTDYTVVGVRYQDKIIPLYSSKANTIAEKCIIPQLYPEYDIVIPEYTIGNSRFDFFLKQSAYPEQKPILMEVKSCSLMEKGTAMFPDAPTSRGKRHVDELAELQNKGFNTSVLFIISHRDTEQFMPNLHTDPDFTASLHQASSKVKIHAVSVDVSEKGSVKVISDDIPVVTDIPAEIAEKNAGVYFIVMKVSEEMKLPISSLGSPVLKPGWYIYAGSAKKNLLQRINRHLRKNKRLRWHIDYLTTRADSIKAFPIRTLKDIECSLAGDIRRISDGFVPKFGSSDCRCPSHLFYFSSNPLQRRSMITLLFTYRNRISVSP
ncbi:MAG: DNA/RNA nuclease SfsA [Spirochaetales bacterium]|nr:DNA/RNA nuclease SfsA [Spirochaetales bacterium]